MYNKQYINNAFLVDSTGFALKYWFSMPPVKTKNFESIAAFLGFASFVIRLLKNYQPKYISFEFDESLGTCFRNELYPDYKKTRESAPDEFIIIECYRKVDPSTYTDIFDDMYLKRYATALIKRQWGANLSKFNGVATLGGVTMNGEQIYTQAVEDIEKLEQAIKEEAFQTPIWGMIG